jgi:ubiquinone/menaquinone biosynthesis C-methylase UbiE
MVLVMRKAAGSKVIELCGGTAPFSKTILPIVA